MVHHLGGKKNSLPNTMIFIPFESQERVLQHYETICSCARENEPFFHDQPCFDPHYLLLFLNWRTVSTHTMPMQTPVWQSTVDAILSIGRSGRHGLFL